MAISQLSKAFNASQQTPLSTLHRSTLLVAKRSLVATELSPTQTVLSRSSSAVKRNPVQKDPGNTPAAAKKMGELNNRRSFRDSVGKKNRKSVGKKNSRSDRNDFYQFSLEQVSHFSLSLRGLKANADVQLFNSNRQVIAASNRRGNQSESINRTLDAGTYYVRVYPRGGATAYSLVLQGSRIQLPPVPVDSLPSQVSSVGASSLTTRGSSSYTFSVTYSDNIGINASSIDSNDILVTGANGFQQTATLVNRTPVGGTSLTAIYQLTAPQGSWVASNSGTYQLVLQPNQISDSSGNFTASATIGNFQVNINNPFSQLYGYGWVDASAAVAKAIGQAPFSNVPDGTIPLAWQVDAVKAPEVWAKGFKGQGVVVAVLDSGVDNTNSSLSNSLWTNAREIPFNNIDDDRNGYVDDVRGWDFVNRDNTPIDIDSHGTFVTGIITNSVSGIAPNAKVMPIKVTNSGSASQTDIADGVYYAVRNGAKIINISYALPPGSISTPAIQQALQFAYQNNVLVVASAGNSRQQGAPRSGDPGHFIATNNYGITVGATNKTGKFADFSNPAGNTPLNYVVAPGVDVYSDSFDSRFNITFERNSGTSFSAPAVAGVAALMLSANPSLTPDRIKQILIDTANPSVLA